MSEESGFLKVPNRDEEYTPSEILERLPSASTLRSAIERCDNEKKRLQKLLKLVENKS